MKKIVENYIEKCKEIYLEDIPDEAPDRLDYLNKVPSYKRIALSILNNDLSKIGYSFHSGYYSKLKEIELWNNGKLKSKQLKLF